MDFGFLFMPRGIHLNQTQKQQIYVGITKGHDDAKIIESVFVADDISPTYISKTIRWLKNVATNDQILSWFAGKIRTGNKSSHALDDPITSHALKVLALARPKRTQEMIVTDLMDMLGDGITICRQDISFWLKRHKITDHAITWVSAHLDEAEREETLRIARAYDTRCLHNFDESCTSYKKFLQKKARCFIGEVPTNIEWSLTGQDGRVYSSIADYTPEGWSVWRTFYCNIDHQCVEIFLDPNTVSFSSIRVS